MARAKRRRKTVRPKAEPGQGALRPDDAPHGRKAASAGPGGSLPGGAVLALAMIAACAAFIVYLPALGNGFVNWDDGLYVYENVRLQNPGSWTLGWFFASFVAGNWHPLTMLSYALDYSLWGLNPKGFHLTSVVLHSFNSFLVFVLFWRLTGAGAGGEGGLLKAGTIGEGLRRIRAVPADGGDGLLKNPRARIAAALVTSLFFALHPVRVESVAWVAERKDVLYGFFFLLACISYTGCARAAWQGGRLKRGRFYYALTLAFFAFSLMSKPMAVTLPLVLLIIDFYPLERRELSWGALLLEKIPFFAMSAASSAVTIMAQRTGDAVKTLEAYPFSTRVLVALRSYMFYLYKSLVPAGLAPFYPYPRDIGLFSPSAALSIVGFIIISALCVYSLRKTRLWCALWLYYVATLVPVIGIVQAGSQAAADRYMYLPGLAVAVVFGLGAAALVDKWGDKKARAPVVTAAAALAVAAVLSFLTVRQTALWREPMTLWDHEISLYPDSVPIAYSNRGNVYYDRGEFKRAVIDYDRAVELDPAFARAFYNRGGAYHKMGDTGKAIEDYSRAIELDPRQGEFYFNRGTTYSQIRELDRAIADYTRALEINPGHAKAYINRGNAYVWAGNSLEGLRNYARAMEADPSNAEAYANRGVVLLELKRPAEALKDFSRAVSIEPGNSRYHRFAGNAYQALGDMERARMAYEKAAALGSKEAKEHIKGQKAGKGERRANNGP